MNGFANFEEKILVMKTVKLSFLFFIALLSATVAKAQWIQKPNLPAATRAATGTFALGNKIYVCGGKDVNAGTIYQDVWEYDVTANTWTKKANFGGGFRSGMVAFTIGTKAYAGMGFNAGVYYNDLWEYDALLDTWTRKADLPDIGREEGAGFSIGNKGYVGNGQAFVSGGNNSFNVAFAEFYEYDPATDVWTQKANFIGGMRAFTVGCGIGNKGYMGFGGDSGQTASGDDLYEYDPATDTWTAKSSLTGVFIADPAMVSIGTDLYVLGGIDLATFNVSNTCSKYNSLTDTWTAEAFFPDEISAPAMAAVNGKLYAGTGFNAALNSRKDWWVLTPASSSTVTAVHNEAPFAAPINLYPNPFSETLSISMNGTGTAYGSALYYYVISDVLGRKILSGSFEKGNAVAQELKLPEGMSKGLYVFTLSNAKGKTVAVQKIVKE
jgi:N-acetylneuraminic acid mutarotase